jgi:hypothetical protein
VAADLSSILVGVCFLHAFAAVFSSATSRCRSRSFAPAKVARLHLKKCTNWNGVIFFVIFYSIHQSKEIYKGNGGRGG